MRAVLLASMSAVLLLSGCATDRALNGHALPLPDAVTAPIAASNRFEMTQGGRQMSAADFDAWMKARGIRIAKGPQSAKAQVRAEAPKPKARTQPKRR